MIPEIRYIIFEKKHLRECLSLYVFRSNCNIPNKKEIIHEIDILDDKTIKFTSVCDEFLNTKIMHIDKNQILSIIIDYCIYKSIPLPVNSTKSVNIMKFGVCLIVALGIPADNILRVQEMITPEKLTEKHQP